MEDDGVVKAPLTRLRRRLSVEVPEDTKSPSSAPSTPTKKRGGRLASKPQLELIDENTPQGSPKKTTRRSLAKENIDEKLATPSRRVTRTRSNTSLTNIVLETTLGCESPRAKRASARRTSLTGSDNEASITPARTTRTRKDSTSSIDKQVETPASKPILTDVIDEEPENTKSRKSITDTEVSKESDDKPTSNIRKSPRLKNKNDSSAIENSNQTDMGTVNSSLPKNESNKLTDNSPTDIVNAEEAIANGQKIDNDSKENTTLNLKEKAQLSSSCVIILQSIATQDKKKNTAASKSMSHLEESNNSINKRQRTKSWTTLSDTQVNEGMFLSDNESSKKKRGKKITLKGYPKQTGSGDDEFLSKSIPNHSEIPLNVSAVKRKKKGSENSFDMDKSIKKYAGIGSPSPSMKGTEVESDKENITCVNSKITEQNVTELFENAPTSFMKTLEISEDSDSNSALKESKVKDDEAEDQCVPVVPSAFVTQQTPTLTNNNSNLHTSNLFANPKINEENNDSCEPMDIDETMPHNVSLTDMSKESDNDDILEKGSVSITQEKTDNSKRSIIKNLVSQTSFQNLDNQVDENSNKSERKSFLPLSIHQTEEQTTVQSNELNNTAVESSTKSKLQPLSLSLSPENNKTEESIKSKRKSSISQTDLYNSITNKKDESKMKSSDSENLSQDIEKTDIESKSTLVLSLVKDISTSEHNVSLPKNEVLLHSVHVPSNKKDITNKNLSLNCLTSTPVQRETKKTALQINTSVITPGTDKKPGKSFKKNNIKKKEPESSDLSENESDKDSNDAESLKCSYIDDEAEIAGDGYESGDSQDEEERQYEKENEIIDEGETLTSDEELSEDTDYEKDSFLVSSDEEDDDLLSGTGDDLGMSDNELSMSAKSKKKFDERKQKEQKKASKEMYKARHGLDGSGDNSKPKHKTNNKEQRIDSRLFESTDDNIVLPPKKNKRLRLESSTLESPSKLETDEVSSKSRDSITAPSSNKKNEHKKKSKKSSQSICNEMEITALCDENMLEEDPLSVKVKQEPKTPQKGLDISIVKFSHRERIEEIKVDENVSMMKASETVDPLHVTMADDNDVSSNSSISENEEIAKNYDSVLNELNKSNPKKIKSTDISLNLNTKSKLKKEEYIIDQLNLTQTKSKKVKNHENKKPVLHLDDEGSSDSIDLKLLFSDDSNDSEVPKTEVNDKYIPLMRTEARTNISEALSKQTSPDENIEEPSSAKKDKKRNHDHNQETTATSDDNNLFFVDTVGIRPDEDETNPINVSLNTSIKENNTMDNDAEPEDIKKTKKRKRKSTEDLTDQNIISEENLEQHENVENAKKRKKKLSANNISGEPVGDEGPTETRIVFKNCELPPKKKRLVSQSGDEISLQNQSETGDKTTETTKDDVRPKAKVRKTKQANIISQNVLNKPDVNDGKTNRKRKTREDDTSETVSKIFKKDYLDNVGVPRLPADILNNLSDKPNEEVAKIRKTKLISTTDFVVEEEKKKKKNKPSQFLEETICLNDTKPLQKPQSLKMKPKVLPFMPTATTSASGFTTHFIVKVLPEKIVFNAQSIGQPSSKHDQQQPKKNKKLTTYDQHKQKKIFKLSRY